MPRLFLFALAINFFFSHVASAQVQYRGLLEQTERNSPSVPVKEFQLNCFPASEDSQTFFYQVEESRPALPWIEQIGTVSPADDLLASNGIALGYRHLDRGYVLPVALPFFPQHDQLQKGASWKDGQGEFEVKGEKTINGHACWDVRATTGIARHHQLYVRKDSPLIQSGTQTVFMGPGDRFQVQFQIESEDKTTDIAALSKLFLDLKSSVKRQEHDRFQPLTNEQVKSLAPKAAEILAAAKGTPLEKFAKEVNENLDTLMSRQGRIEGLAEAMIGKPIPKFTLKNLKSGEIPSSSFAGKTTVLHFWDYANPTLEQPYGQVGYLDFLHNRWAGKNVQVYGVAINSELNDPQTQAKAIRNINRLQQFMRLSYELTFDGGAALNSFGNPTRVGESLPLWVVISPDGTVRHYQTGFYEVDNRVGLKPLDDAIEASQK